VAAPPLEIGTYGEIFESAHVDGKWMPLHRVPPGATPAKYRAAARYRAADGYTRGPLERTDSTINKATKRLKAALVEKLGIGKSGRITASSRFADVAEEWLTLVQQRQAGTTYDRYKGRYENHIKPALGGLLIRECTPKRLNDAFREMERNGQSAGNRRAIKVVVNGILQEAVNQDAISVNPARQMERISGRRRRTKVALDGPALVTFFSLVDGDKRAVHGDLPDFLRMLFGVGCRYGEALALRWRDINLTDEPVVAEDWEGNEVVIPPRSIWFNGNLVHITGRGVVRHHGKTFSSNGVVLMPDFLYLMLLIRKPVGAGLDDPVFPSRTMGWRSPSNMQRSVRRLRLRIGYPKLTTHDGRRAVATALDKAGATGRDIAQILRQSKPSMAQDNYMDTSTPNPAAAAALDRLHKAS
jgi:integrase